ncbi:2-phosphosulfolactate phosphatase [Nocardioides limicola]|uniref:2-phosphosulfolactate phosphatase n=1 Tax=Nocardioides limicola TaxID=2803368 RepID=UPI00193BB055|nr:2-phosphosulfolactate phosphatase [Nocardioides sp. DJM-14]
MADVFGQREFDVRLEWGPIGARATQADIAVVVDVLSFSTAVTVAVERGIRVFPYAWKGAQVAEFAATCDAVLAVGRLDAAKSGGLPAPSLSPTDLMACEAVPRLVLPSPNGSTIAASLAGGGSTVAIGCLRNAGAVAEWLVPAAEAGRSIAVVPAGERWSCDNSLRPALEDHLGAGAILSALRERGYDVGFSPEALVAAEIFDASADTLGERIRACVGGRELISNGFGSDVDVAAALNASSVVPVLVDGAFVSAGPS